MWTWTERQQDAFDSLKQCVTLPPVLRYNDVQKPVTLTSDASQHGLGGLQNGSPVARYAQIEKELLAVVFACFKLYEYIYGKPVIVETDHLPLVLILKNPSTRQTPPEHAEVVQVQSHTKSIREERSCTWQTCFHVHQ